MTGTKRAKGVETVVTAPRILYLHTGPATPEPVQRNLHAAQIKDCGIDVLVVETAMSGAVPTAEPYALVGFIVEAANHIPTFLVPHGQHPQRRRLRCETFYRMELTSNGAIPLDAAYSAQADEILHDITRLWQEDRPELIPQMKAKYQQH